MFFAYLLNISFFLNIKSNFVIMFYSVSKETKPFKPFLDDIFRLLMKQYVFKTLFYSSFSLFKAEDANLFIHETCPV